MPTHKNFLGFAPPPPPPPKKKEDFSEILSAYLYANERKHNPDIKVPAICPEKNRWSLSDRWRMLYKFGRHRTDLVSSKPLVLNFIPRKSLEWHSWDQRTLMISSSSCKTVKEVKGCSSPLVSTAVSSSTTLVKFFSCIYSLVATYLYTFFISKTLICPDKK